MLLPWLLGWEQPADRTAFGAGLHAGSCLGIAWALRDDLRRLSLRDAAGLVAVSVPAAVAGTLAADTVEERLGRPPQLAALLAGAGALMWWVDARAERARQGQGEPALAQNPPVQVQDAHVPAPPSAEATHEWPVAVTVRPHRHGPAPPGGRTAPPDSHRAWRVASVDPTAAAVAGVAQVAALVPGVSRSGATLTALRALGVDRATARRFTLLMSLPITAGAAAHSLTRADRGVLRELGPGLAAGGVAAAVAGAAAATAQRRRPDRPLAGAALYRLGLAAVVAHRLTRKGAP